MILLHNRCDLDLDHVINIGAGMWIFNFC